jgi:radical SAM protein with 4Fe4S-binding SPASM domain
MLTKTTVRYEMNKLRHLAAIHWRAMAGKLTLRQACQIARVLFEWKTRTIHCRSRPFAYRIEPAAGCNLSCPLCSTPFRQLAPGQSKLMKLDSYREIHRQIRPYASRLTFYMEGEPMLNPHLFAMIELSTRSGNVFTSFSTNFTLMREKHLDALFESRLDWISVSLDGFHQASYERYRVGGKVKNVLDSIEMTMRERRARRLSVPYMMVNMIKFCYISEEETRELADFCSTHGVDEFRLRPDQFGLWGEYEGKSRQRPARECHWPWTAMSIDSDGSVYACPIALEQKLAYGNLLREDLDTIWNNELYRATRRYLSLAGDDPRGPRLPCFDCRWYGKRPATDQVAIRRRQLQKRGLPVLSPANAAPSTELRVNG